MFRREAVEANYESGLGALEVRSSWAPNTRCRCRSERSYFTHWPLLTRVDAPVEDFIAAVDAARSKP